MKSGGIISGHDYFVRFPGVVQAVHETVGQENLISLPFESCVWAVVK